MPRNLIQTVPVFFLVTALLVDAGLAASKGNAPRVGEVNSVVVITVSLAVGSTGRDEKRVKAHSSHHVLLVETMVKGEGLL